MDELEQRIFSKIEFINEHLIPADCIVFAENLTVDIDLDDTPFVALNKYLKGKLWTGDKELYNGLIGKGYKQIITTAQLSVLLNN